MKRTFSLNRVISEGTFDRTQLLLPGSLVDFDGRVWRVVEENIEKDRIVLED